MTWARATIFYGSEQGKRLLEEHFAITGAWAGALPALVTSTGVQIVNMPIIRATITLQNPASPYRVRGTVGMDGVEQGWPATRTRTRPCSHQPVHSQNHAPQTTSEALSAIYQKSGLKGLWLGTPAGIAKVSGNAFLLFYGFPLEAEAAQRGAAPPLHTGVVSDWLD